MSQTIRSLKQWTKSNIFIIGISVTSLLSGMILVVFSILAVTDREMMKAIIEAEATILGFLVLFVIYGLTSFDSRLDRLQQQIFDVQTEKANYSREFFEYLNKRVVNVEDSKKDMADLGLSAGIILFTSLLSSILGLGLSGIPNKQWAYFSCLISLSLLYFGMFHVFWIIHGLGKTTT